jgi:uncharacterized protein YbjT (DUF2867 family)
MQTASTSDEPILVLGGTGNSGRRIMERLRSRGLSVRVRSRLMTFREVARDLAHAIGRPIDYVDVPHDAFIGQLADSGAPEEIVWLLGYLFPTVLDGHNASLADGVERALDRPPRDLARYAQNAAHAGAWEIAA